MSRALILSLTCIGLATVASCGSRSEVEPAGQTGGLEQSAPVETQETKAAPVPTLPKLSASESERVIADKQHEAELAASTTLPDVRWPAAGISLDVDAPAPSAQFLSSCMVFLIQGGNAYTMYVGNAGRDDPEQGAVLLIRQDAATGEDLDSRIFATPQADGALACDKLDGDVLLAKSSQGAVYKVDVTSGKIQTGTN